MYQGLIRWEYCQVVSAYRVEDSLLRVTTEDLVRAFQHKCPGKGGIRVHVVFEGSNQSRPLAFHDSIVIQRVPEGG